MRMLAWPPSGLSGVFLLAMLGFTAASSWSSPSMSQSGCCLLTSSMTKWILSRSGFLPPEP